MSSSQSYVHISKTKLPVSLFFYLSLAAYVIVRLTQATRPHIFIWDEAVYYSMGKYIYSFGAQGLWEALRPVFFPLLLGIFNPEFLMILLSSGTCFLTFLVGKELLGDKGGTIAGILMTITPLYFLYSSHYLTSIPSAFFMLLSVYFFLKKRYFTAGILTSLTFLTRFPSGLLLVALGLALIIPKKSLVGLKKYVAGFGVPIIPFLAFNYILYRKVATFFDALLRPLIFAAPHQSNQFAPSGDLLFYPSLLLKGAQGIAGNPLFVFAFLGVALYIFYKLYRKQSYNAVFFALLLFVSYYTYISNKQARFALIFVPMVCIFSALGITWTIEKLKRYKTLRALFVLVLLIPVIVNVSVQESYIHWRSSQESPMVTDYYRYTFPSNAVVLTSDPVPAAYSDNLFVPYYFSVIEGLPIARGAILNQTVDYVIFTPGSFPCSDDWCNQKRNELFSLIRSNELIFNKTYNSQTYEIYKVT